MRPHVALSDASALQTIFGPSSADIIALQGANCPLSLCVCGWLAGCLLCASLFVSVSGPPFLLRRGQRRPVDAE